MAILETLWEGISNALLMAWAVWWALVLGFAISAIVQAWAPRERIERSLGDGGGRSVGLATALGAASSSCSYAAIAIAKSLFAKGASAASSLAFQFASTNLVVELGLVIWVLLGWQFALAELIGGLVLIAIMTALLRLFVSRRVEERARAHAQAAEASHAGERARGTPDRGRELRVLGGEHPPGGGAVVRGDRLRRGDRVHLRGPDRGADRVGLPQVLRRNLYSADRGVDVPDDRARGADGGRTACFPPPV